MNNNNKSLSAAGDQPASAEQGSKGVLKLGLDMHYRQVTVAMQEDCGPLKAVGKLSQDGFWGWVQKKQKEGWEVYSCYEAGASGYWLHRDLVGIGIKNQVVAPKATGQDKRQKTDRRDSAELLDCLDQYLRGKKTALNPVAIPSLELEKNRALVRFHRQLMADRSRYESRGKGLLCAQGIELRASGGQPRHGKSSRLMLEARTGSKSSLGLGAASSWLARLNKLKCVNGSKPWHPKNCPKV